MVINGFTGLAENFYRVREKQVVGSLEAYSLSGNSKSGWEGGFLIELDIKENNPIT